MSRDEAVRAAAEALTLIPGTSVTYPKSVAATVVDAVWPVIERAVRAQAAAEVRADVDPGHGACDMCEGRLIAARIVEGP